jgi:hypothetical protein
MKTEFYFEKFGLEQLEDLIDNYRTQNKQINEITMTRKIFKNFMICLGYYVKNYEKYYSNFQIKIFDIDIVVSNNIESDADMLIKISKYSSIL